MDTAHQIVRERRRQISEKGYTPEHDDEHAEGELLLGAFAYLCSPGDGIWPWADGFNPSADPVENLVRAGAMIAAEGDRLLRRREAGLSVVGGMILLSLDPEELLASIDDLREIGAEMKNLGISARLGSG